MHLPSHKDVMLHEVTLIPISLRLSMVAKLLSSSLGENKLPCSWVLLSLPFSQHAVSNVSHKTESEGGSQAGSSNGLCAPLPAGGVGHREGP